MTEERTEETRQLIVRKARALFMELGYRAVSTRMVASACGLTQPALYHHFSGKQDLYVAVLLDELARLGLALTAIVRLDGTGLERLGRAALFLTESTDVDHALMAHDIRWELSSERRLHVAVVFKHSLVDPMQAILNDTIKEGAMRRTEELGIPVPVAVMHFLNVVRFVVTSAHEQQAGGVPGVKASSHRERTALAMTLFLEGMGRPYDSARAP